MVPHKKAIIALLLAVLVVLSTVPLPIAAQGSEEQTLLLDTDQTEVGTVQVDGTAYTVYERENLLPYASGLEVYRNGERVTDETEARRAVRKIAWRRAATRLGSADKATLRQIDDRIRTLNGIVTPAIQVLDLVLGAIEELKQTQVLGTSAWDAVTKASPAASELEPAVREARTELQDWKAAADQVNENVPRVVDSLERIEQGEDVDYNELSQRFAAAMEGMDRLETKSQGVSETLRATAKLSADASSDVQGVPVVGGELATLLTRTSTGLESAASDTRAFGNTLGEQRSQLSEVQATAEAEERAMMSAWEARQSAEMKVHGTLGGGGAAMLGAIVVLGRRFV